MVYLNKNYSLQTLRSLIQQEFQRKTYKHHTTLNEQQKEILELFNKRIFLEEVVEEAVSFNKKLTWDDATKNVGLVTSAEELIEVFSLRSEIYTDINYQDEFPDTIEGLNFDSFDKNSAILVCKNSGQATGTARIIFDSKQKLPSEAKFSFDYMREKVDVIGEISRLIIKHQQGGLSVDFKNLMRGIHDLFIHNALDITISGIKKEHYKLYSKFGGIAIEKELGSYGQLDVPFLIISWDPSQASAFFHRSFLR